MDHTQHLSNFLSSLQYSSLPLSVVTAAKLSILNALGCGLGYALHASANKTFSYIQRTQPQEASGTILGRPQRTSIENAALINGIAITTADFDDTHLRTVIHPSGTPLAALLALAERYPLTGEDFLLAFIAGVECQLAIGNAISPAHYKDGWHITGTTGTFGATAAVAKALKLDAKQFASALGHASSMAGGTRAMFGTDTKTLHMGRGAQNGLLAAELARDGFGSAERAIESWARLVSNAVKEDQISALADEGKERRWQILENTFKPYPCGIVIHPLIDAGIACHEWLVEEDVAVPIEQIQSIEATVNPQCVRLCNVRHPQTGLETIFSLYHGIASGILYGEGGPERFSDKGCNDEAMRTLRDKVSVTTHDSIDDDAALLKVVRQSQDGAVTENTFVAEHATGSLATPMDQAAVEAKFRMLAAAVLNDSQINRTIEIYRSMEQEEDMASFVRGLAAV